MNEDIIRTFANQASEYAEGLELNQGELTPELLKARDLKLVELIVKECIGQCEDARFKQTNTVPKEYANRRLNMCILTIKEYFGVE